MSAFYYKSPLILAGSLRLVHQSNLDPQGGKLYIMSACRYITAPQLGSGSIHLAPFCQYVDLTKSGPFKASECIKSACCAEPSRCWQVCCTSSGFASTWTLNLDPSRQADLNKLACCDLILAGSLHQIWFCQYVNPETGLFKAS